MPRTCTVCTHSKRAEIDKALLSGDAFRNIAERFSVSLGALTRHKEAHLSQRMAEVAARNAEADIRTAIDVVAQLKAINGASLSILEDARAAKDGTLALQAIDRIQKQIELQARLIDLIRDGDTINVVISPQWMEIRTVILTALQPYPDADRAVANGLQLMDGGKHHAGA
jgi:hypothetical protein